MDFSSTGLNEVLLKAVDKLGFTEPTPVQAEVLPILLQEATDFVGLAQTGTGKTGAFGLPLLQQVDLTRKDTQSLILCPTRELCLQITKDLEAFGRFMDGLNVVAVYGGAPIVKQITRIKRGAQVIVATPGRLLDLIRRNVVKLGKVSRVILDEADEMLNMGFQEDIDAILSQLPEERNVWLFSATMPRGVERIAKSYLRSPAKVTIGKANESAANIQHHYCMVHEKHRYQALKRLMDFYPRMYALVFCRTRKETQQIAEDLLQDGYVTEALHGDLSQAQRDTVMRKFRNQGVKILVATDVAARGLDVNDLTHIIHYRLPENVEIYTHRSGRTARAGKSGDSIAIVNLNESRRVRGLEHSGIPMQSLKIPSGRAICEKQLFYLVEKIVNTEVNEEEIAAYLPKVYDALGGFDKEELIKRLVHAEFSLFLDYYRHADDINVQERKGKERSAPGRRENDAPRDRPRHSKIQNPHRLFINVGLLDNIGAGAIVRVVCEYTGLSSDMIGGIKLNREFSFFEVDQEVAAHVKSSMTNARMDGRPLKVSDQRKQQEQKSEKKYPKKPKKHPKDAKRHKPGGKRNAKDS